MKLKFLLVFTLISFFSIAGFTQAPSWEMITGSPLYIYGEGWGTTVAEADRQALNDLLSKISVQVSGKTTQSESETLSNGQIESTATFNSLIHTYSTGTLTNTEKVILENEPDAHVGRWMLRSDVAKIIENRKNKIADYIASALKAESKGKIDVALKDLYWAFALTKTLQDPNGFEFVSDEGERIMPITWVPHKMDEIFDNITIEGGKRNGDDLELNIFYLGKPVNSIDYTYFDGRDWSNIYTAKDGVGVLELAPGSQNSYYQLKFEYEYAGQARIDKEIAEVLNSVAGTPMRKAYKSVKAEDLTKSMPVMAAETTLANSFASVDEEDYRMPASLQDNEKYKAILSGLSQAIVRKRYDDMDDLFTPEAKDIYQRLIKYGNAKIVGTPEFVFYEYDGNVIARGLQMSFSFKSGMRKSFVEDVVFSFNKEGKINNISFGLGRTAEADIMGKGLWSENARMAIMNFLENYQTAYALQRLDYIESIFDDDAVIITATVTKAPGRRVKNGDMTGIVFDNDIIKYNRHTKDTFLKHLANSFKSKEYINLRFADNDVRLLGKGGELYGIQISQEYYSSNYGDKGYLFLIVDLNDPEAPMIKVRTWQPEKDPEFGLYGPEHFK